ncbi:MAG: SET domain-containing protein [Nanoarchaeota archaeon]|nr:SET domain-containing protein [Nanoarchaeota archaeon]
MFVVKTKVKESGIHGRGLFADQDIKKGQIIWRYNSLIDRKIPQKKLLQLPSFVQKFVKYYSYLNDRDDFVLCGDGTRYINHSDNPNTEDKVTFWDKLFGREGISMASKNIKKGEEITSKYLRFDKKGNPKHIVQF